MLPADPQTPACREGGASQNHNPAGESSTSPESLSPERNPRGGLYRPPAAKYAAAKMSVWWDIENCRVPKLTDPHDIAQNISMAVMRMGYKGPVSIHGYGNIGSIPDDVIMALSSTGVGLNYVPPGVKNSSDKKLLVDMLIWAIDNPAPANLLLISGDRDFSSALHQLGLRRYNILLAQPQNASVPLLSATKTVWLWRSLANGDSPLLPDEDLVGPECKSRNKKLLTVVKTDTKYKPSSPTDQPKALNNDVKQPLGEKLEGLNHESSDEDKHKSIPAGQPSYGGGISVLEDKSKVVEMEPSSSHNCMDTEVETEQLIPNLPKTLRVEEEESEHKERQMCENSDDNEQGKTENLGKRTLDASNDSQAIESATKKMKHDFVQLPNRTCYACRESGHFVKDCPNNNLSKNPTVLAHIVSHVGETSCQSPKKACFKCGQSGHVVKDCPNQLPKKVLTHIVSHVGEASCQSPKKVCFKCGQSGHVVKGCPNQLPKKPKVLAHKGSHVGDPCQVSNKQCFKCGQMGHLKGNCTY